MSEEAWYYSQFGSEPQGPFSRNQMLEIVQNRKVLPKSTLVSVSGGRWIDLGESEIYHAAQNIEAERAAAPPAPPLPVNPYQSPAAPGAAGPGRGDNPYGGTGRILYWFGPLAVSLLICLGLAFVLFLFSNTGEDGSGLSADTIERIILFVVYPAIAFFSLYYSLGRLKNLGMSRWNILWSLVPLMHIWIGWRMACCPAAYADHKKLDTAGKILTFLIILFFVLAVAAAGLLISGAGLEALESARSQKLP